MGLSSSLFVFLNLLLKVVLLLLFDPLLAHSFTSLQAFCHEEERSALLQFKRNYFIDKFSCQYEGDYPKASYWESQGESSSTHDNCCLWDGVECDEETGHVIGLDLNSGCLYGSIDSSSTLFHLVHLQKLNLAYNHFNFSSIPTAIGKLSEMTYLNLSYSAFSGQIPYEISWLSKLSSLDLSSVYDHAGDEYPLKLKNPSLGSLVQNLTCLEMLQLDYIDMSSQVPDSLANLSSLTQVSLAGCRLYGFIPSSLGKLTQLNHLGLELNGFSGYFPSFIQNLTLLTYLGFGDQITGSIPYWLGNLTKLAVISIRSNNLYGSIPQSLSRLKNLEALDLQENNLGGTLKFDMFFKMRRLTHIILSDNNFSFLFGERSISINATLPQFKSLALSSCNLSEFPNFLRHQNKLKWLDLSNNNVYGQVPKWILNSSVETLSVLDMSNNFLTGFHDPQTTLPWVHLRILDLHSNLLQGQLPIPASFIRHYDISYNKLSGEISPLFRNLSSVVILDLSNNNFPGIIPRWLGNFSDLLLVLNLRDNLFDGSVCLACKDISNLRMIDFSRNQLQGQFPRSLTTCMMLEYLDFSHNQLIDVFPTWLGTCPELKVLTLHKNRFYGVIRKTNSTPQFPRLRIIDLAYNNFTGLLPLDYIFTWNAIKSNSTYMNARETFDFDRAAFPNHYSYNYSTFITTKSVETHYEKIREELAVIDLSSNKFSSEIPSFVGNLTALYSLNLSNNMLTGPIPSSLGNLSELESLDLSQNMLSGEIPHQLTQLKFLQSFNVSHNNLTGPIPQGDQLRTFDQTSFEGNPGLCGEPLTKECQNSKALPPSSVDEEDYDDSGSPIILDWKFILAGFISGLVVGVALGDMVMAKRQRWLVKMIRQRRN